MRRAHAIIATAIAVLCVAVYAPSVVQNGFVNWDDPLLIVENPVATVLTPHAVFLAFTMFDPELYVPITTLSLQVTSALFGVEPWAFHGGNLLLHIISSLLLFSIVASRRPLGTAAVVAAIFAVHPINAESVLWASARKDALSVAFSLLSCRLWIADNNRGGRLYWASAGIFILALLSKISVAPALLLFPIVSDNTTHGAWRRLVPFAAAAALLIVVALVGKSAQQNATDLPTLLLLGSRAVTMSLSHIIVPTHLSVTYPFFTSVTLGTPAIGWSVFMVAIITLLAWILRKRTPAALRAWSAFLLLLAPSFFNAAKGQDLVKDLYVTSDRYAYLAAIPIVWLGVEALFVATRRRQSVALAVAGIIVVLFSLQTMRQSAVWKSTESLFVHAVETNNANAVVWGILGTLWLEQGEQAKGLDAYERSVTMKPTSRVLLNIGILSENGGFAADAEARYREALALRPSDAVILYRLGALIWRERRDPEALQLLRRSDEERATPPEVARLLAEVQEALEN